MKRRQQEVYPFKNVRRVDTRINIRWPHHVEVVAFDCPDLGLVVELHEYSDYDDEYSVLGLSLWDGGVQLGEDEFVCHNHGVYREILRQLIAAGLVEDTGREIRQWFATDPLHVCRLKGELTKSSLHARHEEHTAG